MSTSEQANALLGTRYAPDDPETGVTQNDRPAPVTPPVPAGFPSGASPTPGAGMMHPTGHLDPSDGPSMIPQQPKLASIPMTINTQSTMLTSEHANALLGTRYAPDDPETGVTQYDRPAPVTPPVPASFPSGASPTPGAGMMHPTGHLDPSDGPSMIPQQPKLASIPMTINTQDPVDHLLANFHFLKDENVIMLHLLRDKVVELLASSSCLLMQEESHEHELEEGHENADHFMALSKDMLRILDKGTRARLSSMCGEVLSDCGRFNEASSALWEAHDLCMEADVNSGMYAENLLSRMIDIMTFLAKWGKVEEAVVFGSKANDVMGDKVSPQLWRKLQDLNALFVGKLTYSQSWRFYSHSGEMEDDLFMMMHRSDPNFDKVQRPSTVIDLGVQIGKNRKATLGMDAFEGISKKRKSR